MSRLIIALGLLVALYGQALAWGEEGHSIVAEIAQRRLTPAARAAIEDLLGPGVSLASISSWADDVRNDRPQSYNWHFVDIPLDQTTYDPKLYCQEDTKKGDCIINEIERARLSLADTSTSKEKRAEALMFLVHFIGDVHQPLHTVAENRGETLTLVTFFIDPLAKIRVDTNLHAVWDTGLIRYRYWDWGDYVRALEAKWLPGKDYNQLVAGTPVEWALQAHDIAVKSAVPGVSNGDALDATYATRVQPYLDEQLALAGLRLAKILNDTLK